jgi:hypothetical protein
MLIMLSVAFYVLVICGIVYNASLSYLKEGKIVIQPKALDLKNVNFFKFGQAIYSCFQSHSYLCNIQF